MALLYFSLNDACETNDMFSLKQRYQQKLENVVRFSSFLCIELAKVSQHIWKCSNDILPRVPKKKLLTV